MFDVEYKGANAVVFTTKKTRVVFDPNVSVAGGKDVSAKGDIVVLTEERLKTNTESKLLFDGPGEYEASDIALTGVAARRHIDTDEQGKQSRESVHVISSIQKILGSSISSGRQQETEGTARYE